MSTNTAPPIPTPAEIKAWPKFKTWALGITPGPTSHLRQDWNGDYLWIYGGMLYDSISHTISAYSMKDATDRERTAVSRALEARRRQWFQGDGETTRDKILSDENWQPVDGREGVFVVALARACPFGGPDMGMELGAASEIGEDYGHFETMLDTDVDGLDGKRKESEFILHRVWSPEHGVQLAVRIEDRTADGPGQPVNNLVAFHQRLGEEIERLLQDHPEQAGYSSGE
ncbi:hypothetical protein OG312_10470 [Kocuria rhizophila]|uniref:hypothetical protein n=1 Tax=Kocuria rhizophila TaxID=72000 RepID=UPI002E125D13|nr:hypothetical protein OG312_10470 [Kocuria rhizophila]